VSIILFSVLFVTSLYILATLVINEHRSKRVVTKKGVKYLRWILLCASTFSTLFYVTCLCGFELSRNLTEYYQYSDDHENATLSTRTRHLCQVINTLQKVFYTTCIFSIYFLFWLRQKLFYSSPSVSDLYSSRFQQVSRCVLALIVLCYTVQTCLSIVGLSYYVEEDLCWRPQPWLQNTQMVLGAVTSVLTHVALLPLFVYPLLRHRQLTNGILHTSSVSGNTPKLNSTRSFNSNGSTHYTKRNLISFKGGDLLLRRDRQMVALIKRCCVITLLCVLINLTATVTTLYYYHTDVVNVGAFVYGFNILVNVSSAVGVLKRCRKIMMPWRAINERRKDLTSSQSNRLLNSNGAHQQTRTKSDYKSVEI